MEMWRGLFYTLSVPYFVILAWGRKAEFLRAFFVREVKKGKKRERK
jgi:hypothetical protein